MGYNRKKVIITLFFIMIFSKNVYGTEDDEISEYDFIVSMFDNFSHDNPHIRASYLPTAFENHMKSLSGAYLLEIFKKTII